MKMRILFYGWIVIFLFFDLWTKGWMARHLVLGNTQQVIKGWLSWKLIHNPGASFGLFSGHWAFLIFFQLLLIVFIFILRAKSQKSFFVDLGFAMVIGGAIGNLVSRVSTGYVVDFISFRFWPAVFNIADVEIRTGVLLLIVMYLKRIGKPNT